MLPQGSPGAGQAFQPAGTLPVRARDPEPGGLAAEHLVPPAPEQDRFDPPPVGAPHPALLCARIDDGPHPETGAGAPALELRHPGRLVAGRGTGRLDTRSQLACRDLLPGRKVRAPEAVEDLGQVEVVPARHRLLVVHPARVDGRLAAVSEDRVVRVGPTQALGPEGRMPGCTEGEERLELHEVGVGTTRLLARDHVLPRGIASVPGRAEPVKVAVTCPSHLRKDSTVASQWQR